MSATADHPPLRAVPFRVPPARLALNPVPSCPGSAELGGAWWPRSRDLTQELPALADALDPLWGRTTRIAVNRRYWPILPRRIFVNGRVVKVGWFTSELDPHTILLMSGTAGRRNLLVIPPETGAPSAARLMTAASASTGLQSTASALMAAEPAEQVEHVEQVEQVEQVDQVDGISSAYQAAAAVRPGRPAAGL